MQPQQGPPENAGSSSAEAAAATAATAVGTSSVTVASSSAPKAPAAPATKAPKASAPAKASTAAAAAAASTSARSSKPTKTKKTKKRKESKDEDGKPKKKKSRKNVRGGRGGGGGNAAGQNTIASLLYQPPHLSAAQKAVQEQMRRALEEDKYSAAGSIVDINNDDEDGSDSEGHSYHMYRYRGMSVRLDKAALQQAVRKHNLLERLSGGAHNNPLPPPQQQAQTQTHNRSPPYHHPHYNDDDYEHDDEDVDGYYNYEEDNAAAAAAADPLLQQQSPSSKTSKKKKNRRNNKNEGVETTGTGIGAGNTNTTAGGGGGAVSAMNNVGGGGGGIKDPLSLDPAAMDDEYERDGGSIFGATAGSSNSTWVECDKCKKWRRLRGVVDEKKLPSKWYCSMNKNDPDRARCSAPEEEYETPHTPESAADARTRKHLRVWVRRLQCNEAFEAQQPTLTRGKKRATASSAKDPYEWVRCCNPSCGKWRAILRSMDAKTNVIDRTSNGEWYCVMNTWDEKTASCAAPQENLPAVGCPPWVMQDEN